MRTILMFLFFGCLAVLMYCSRAAHWMLLRLPEVTARPKTNPREARLKRSVVPLHS